jgi:WD40 repeat protein
LAKFQVQIINPISIAVHKALTKFRDAVYGARFRRDGQLLVMGNADGQVRLFGVDNKLLLRTFSGHSNATHRAVFLSDWKQIASFSDDKTVR